MMVNLRLSALGRLEKKLPLAARQRDEDRGERGRRPVIFESEAVECPVYLRSGFRPGDRLKGPAMVEEIGATILVYPGDRMEVNKFGHLVIDVATAQS
jgi:N-methylhydantoinase A